MQRLETRGLVLYNRNFREDDKLVKIFTEGAGKRMFLVKHASRSKLTSGIQALTLADYSVKLNEEGLGYIDDVHEIQTFKEIQGDICIRRFLGGDKLQLRGLRAIIALR